MNRRMEPLVYRAPCANLPRGVYRWALPDGSIVVFAIDSKSRLVAIAKPSADGIASLWSTLNASDPRPRHGERVGEEARRPHPSLHLRLPHLALVR